MTVDKKAKYSKPDWEKEYASLLKENEELKESLEGNQEIREGLEILLDACKSANLQLQSSNEAKDRELELQCKLKEEYMKKFADGQQEIGKYVGIGKALMEAGQEIERLKHIRDAYSDLNKRLAEELRTANGEIALLVKNNNDLKDKCENLELVAQLNRHARNKNKK